MINKRIVGMAMIIGGVVSDRQENSGCGNDHKGGVVSDQLENSGCGNDHRDDCGK